MYGDLPPHAMATLRGQGGLYEISLEIDFIVVSNRGE